MLLAEHQKWASIHAPPCLAQTEHVNHPDPDRRLRIGYISPDFCSHAVAFFFEPLLSGHNREAVHLYGYGNVRTPGVVTERMIAKFDHYRAIFGRGDDDVVHTIVSDQIDILVDLAGHSADNRLAVFARKAAPIQVLYLGYFDTSGMEAMDYFLTDRLAGILPERIAICGGKAHAEYLRYSN